MADKSTEDPDIYHIVFEEYLQPKQPRKANNLIIFSNGQEADKRPPLRLKLLEHPTVKSNSVEKKSYPPIFERNKNKFLNIPLRFENTKLKIALSKLFHFLLPRQDDGLCKRKSGFEIYCEMASIHGFVNFIHAKTWQRVFWTLVICFAICMIFTILTLSWTMNNETPTIFYTEGITFPSWTVPLPAVTVCNLNKISRRQAIKVAEKFQQNSTLSQHEMLRIFRFAFYTHLDVNATQEDIAMLHQLLQRNNYTIEKLLYDISPKCGSDEFKMCKWRGHHERCHRMMDKVATSHGICCAFNFWATKWTVGATGPEYSTSSNYQMGVSVLLNPDVDDYWLSFHKIAGYQVFIHDSFDVPNKLVEALIVPAKTETSINVSPRATYGTVYLRRKSLKTRRCYFPDERVLKTFAFYSQTNCMAECRSSLVHEHCGCVPVFWPMPSNNWNVCQTATELDCSVAYRNLSSQMLVGNEHTNAKRYFAYEYICDCFPLCSYNQYTTQMESGPLDHQYSTPNTRLFKGIRKVKDHVLLHVFYGDLLAEKYRLDVTENWLSFVGTIGGIGGLYIGYSFVSGFEMVFFVFVRPVCNWMTKQQIRYRLKKKNKTHIKKNVKAQKELDLGVD